MDNIERIKLIEDAEYAFSSQDPGSHTAHLKYLLRLCETEEEEQVAISGYMRCRRAREMALKKASRYKTKRKV